MTERRNIAQELQEAGSKLPADLTVLPYAVPAGFFEAFPGRLLARLHTEAAPDPAAELESLSPLLAGLSRNMPFTVPEGYFGAAPAIPGVAELPALLATHDRKLPYAVPDGYFESLPGALLEAVRPKARVVPMLQRTRWYRTAAAAVVAGLLAIGGWFYSGSGSSTATDVATAPAAWVEKRLNSVPDGDLEAFIETADPAQGANLASSSPRKAEVRSLLNDVSDTEMAAFLEQVPTDDEHLTMIN
ncbi:MAG: hypothetical protein EOO11_04115 [Chitinophagaceae bacterium]|nr:MAG: hypothetical protein EOO11_04115 [Chitinophagaceae bacterium]